MELLNFSLLKHPLNWVIVLLMITIFGLALHLTLDFYGVNPGK
jgi:hypothetical protein